MEEENLDTKCREYKLKAPLNIVKILVSISFILVAFGVASTAQAASLYFSPNSGSYAVNGTISLSIYVSSADQAMNAASGVVSFPQDKLQVISLSKTGSIFSLWVAEPSFSNSDGTVNLEGITLNPGFTGASGKILSVVFKVKSSGSASISFSSGSVLANDGNGTNILTNLGTAQFNLSGTAVPQSNVPAAPEISSATHPDQEKWYALNDAKFNWQLASDITAMQFVFDQVTDTIPTTSSALANEKEITSIQDGISYFHLRLANKYGWSKIGTFKVQIDTQPPLAFDIQLPDGNQTTNSQPRIVFGTTDSLSGIDYYGVKIGDNDFLKVEPSQVAGNTPYTLPTQTPGQKTILIRAFDKAGNYTDSQIQITILPGVTIQSTFLKIIALLTNIFSLIIPLVALIALLIFIILYAWYRFYLFTEKLREKACKKETEEEKKSFYRVINLLRKNIQEQIDALEEIKSKRNLTEEEEKIVNHLKKYLNEAEASVKEEIGEIKEK